jgi:hypothetical protein
VYQISAIVRPQQEIVRPVTNRFIFARKPVHAVV